MTLSVLLTAVAFAPLVPILFLYTLQLSIRALGWTLQHDSSGRRETIFLQTERERKALDERLETQQEADEGWEKVENSGTAPNGQIPAEDWNGIIGFFHPFCNAGGGGERVLWAAIAATQRRWPNAICAVYTGDHEIEKSAAVAKVKERFDITLQHHSLHFMYLSTRHFVLASTWPNFTLLGQSLGSLILAYDAFHLLVPDIFIDTMGYAFAVAFCKFLFPSVPTAAYVHYPTISTDMIESLDDKTGTKGMHSGAGTGFKGRTKRSYWKLFASLYGWVGRHIDVVMCNSTWTHGHITKLWRKKRRSSPESVASIVYPPCPVEEIESKIQVSSKSESTRENVLLYIAQFRPEKNHSLILRAFSKYTRSNTNTNARLVLIGSVRSNTPDEKHVYNLRLEARELKIDDTTAFICDAPFKLIQEYLQKASVSVNCMYSEHFGIGNVEGIAAGLIPVVHNSGGPKLDIVVPHEGEEIGYLAETDDEYAEAFRKIDAMSNDQRFEMRLRARKSARRFTEKVFADKWIAETEKLVRMSGFTSRPR